MAKFVIRKGDLATHPEPEPQPQAAGPRFVIRKGEVARIAPLPLGDLTWARGASEVGGQRVVVAWRIIDGDFCIDVDLPEDYSGRVPVYVPWKEEPVGYATGGHTQLVV